MVQMVRPAPLAPQEQTGPLELRDSRDVRGRQELTGTQGPPEKTECRDQRAPQGEKDPQDPLDLMVFMT